MFRPNPVKTIREGRAYNGTWHLDGERLLLSSAYGSAAEPAEKDPVKRKAQAERMFAAMLRARG
jgi:hypothetical protein